MITLNFHDLSNDEPAWPAPDGTKVNHVQGGQLRVFCLEGGLTSGRPSVALGWTDAAGVRQIIECTAREFCTAARAILARYPDLFDDPPAPTEH